MNEEDLETSTKSNYECFEDILKEIENSSITKLMREGEGSIDNDDRLKMKLLSIFKKIVEENTEIKVNIENIKNIEEKYIELLDIIDEILIKEEDNEIAILLNNYSEELKSIIEEISNADDKVGNNIAKILENMEGGEQNLYQLLEK